MLNPEAPFIDSVGKTVKEQTVFGWGGDERVVFSEDGAYGVYLLEGMGKGAMAIFDSAGNIRAKYEEAGWLPLGPGEVGAGESQIIPNVRISPEASIAIIADKKGNLICFDFSGVKLWTVNYMNPINIALSSDGKRLIVFEITRDSSKYTLLDGKTGQVVKSSKIELYRAPGIPGKPEYMEEKPWAYFKTIVLNNLATLTYADARNNNKQTISGALVFDFEGNMLSATSWDKPERIIKGNQNDLLILRNGGVKKWQLDTLK